MGRYIQLSDRVFLDSGELTMAKRKAKTKKKNPADLTARNNNARKKEIAYLNFEVGCIRDEIEHVSIEIAHLQDDLKYLVDYVKSVQGQE